MNRPSRRARPRPRTRPLAPVAAVLLALAAPRGLPAQDLAPRRFDAAAAPAAPFLARVAAAAADADTVEAARPAVGRVAAGTVLGGIVGGGLGALGGALLGSMSNDDDAFISPEEAFAALGFIGGYTLGSAAGARRAATIDGARPGFGRLVVISALAAALGGLVWNRVGEGLESEGSMSSWYIGAAAGVGTHVLVTTHAARRAPRVAPAAFPAAPPR